MKSENYMNLEFPSRSANEAFARSAIACFAAQLDPTLDELGDIKTAVSEAVTNCIVHAYPRDDRAGHPAGAAAAGQCAGHYGQGPRLRHRGP